MADKIRSVDSLSQGAYAEGGSWDAGERSAAADVPFVAEFVDPDIYARMLASTGPGYEAIQNVGEAAFADAANEAIAHLREGLPLRAELALVGYLARAPRQSLS
jgi:hypothetical protein